MTDRPDPASSPVEAPSLGLDFAAAPAPAAAAAPYRVLARKYRPSTFDDLIGQEPMVRTLANAFDAGRVHQAYILTGVRGVGKTTTARILARAFNYEVPGKVSAPTIHMPELGAHCQAIIESRHVDVIEMDAASHTGIDDVREIIDNARYKPVMARTKVYIVDEVHMLSKAAFNGLLKTLEEPPEHVKFLFATTEIDKVPVTVRSRCQRFDLRRVEADQLARHLSTICGKEGVQATDDALALIARAAEGSVRDALSLLDQAIAHGAAGARIEAEEVRGMLGLADRSRVIDLFEALMRGDVAQALGLLKEQYDHGADPAQILADLGGFVHFVTRLKIVPEAARDPSMTPEEVRRGLEFSRGLGIRVLTRAWQMLLKGLQEVREAPRPLAAADMVLVRIAHAADLPTLDEALKMLDEGGGASPASGRAPLPRGGGPTPSALLATDPGAAPRVEAPRGEPARGPALSLARAPAQPASRAAPIPAPATPTVAINSLEELVALAEQRRDIMLKLALENDVRLVSFERGKLQFALAPGASQQLPTLLSRRLQEWTGERWMVALSQAEGQPTLRERADSKREQALQGVAAEPAVRSVLEAFPGAQIIAVRRPQEAAQPAAPEPEAAPEADADISYLDETVSDDDL
ncbi:MAG: DNA polymerase III subunit gamma/tau [Rhizobiales bacterium]|nr:DNA polymerase III subunit gamma/tau [Hyphomicrobiales bacterium]